MDKRKKEALFTRKSHRHASRILLTSPTSRGLSAGSAGSNDGERFLDPADKPRDVGLEITCADPLKCETRDRLKALFVLCCSFILSGLLDAQTRISLIEKIPALSSFSEKRITLNFQDIPVRSVLKVLADFIGMNMVVSDAVTGHITLRLENVSPSEALNIILTARALDKRQIGKVLFIAPASEIATNERQAFDVNEARREMAPLKTDLILVRHAKAEDIATILKDKINGLISRRGSINVDSRTNSIWIQDTHLNLQAVHDLIYKLDKPSKQVLIESRIVDVTKDVEEDFGIKWGLSHASHVGGTLNAAQSLAQGTLPGNVPTTDRLNVDLGALPFLNTPASVGIALAQLGSGILLDLELSAIESEGRGEVIASPRLITANQQEAVIESGEEIPYQQKTSSGATAVSFKKAVLSLKVIPHITPDNRILMQIKINQDRPSERMINGVPAILTKELETNVLVHNGQTIVLGGIYKRDKTNNVVRVPFFGTLPIVGSLFRRTSTAVNNEELLIFITPKIIIDEIVKE